MGLPKQVERQLAEAQLIDNAIAGKPAPDAPPAPEATPVTPPADPVPPAPADPQPDLQNTPPAAPEPVPTVPPVDNRYEVLKGKYNAEVPRLHEENNRLAKLMEVQEAELQRLRQAAQRPPEPPAPLVTTKDSDDFGADMVDMVHRVALDTITKALIPRINAEVAEIKAKIATIETGMVNVAQKQNMTAEDRFYEELTRQVSDWQEVNVNPQWLAWLGTFDDMLGGTRQQALDAAASELNVKRTVAIFNQFKKEHQVAAPQAATPPAPRPAQQVSPPRGATAAPAAQAPENIWTESSIKAFYRDVQMGRFRGRESEMQQIEADLDAAYSEGRIRQG